MFGRKTKADACINSDYESMLTYATNQKNDNVEEDEGLITQLALMHNKWHEFRFIQLMPKHSSKVVSVDNYVAPLLLNFSQCRICSKHILNYKSINLHSCRIELKSKCFTVNSGCMFLHLGRDIATRLLLSPIISKHGISVVGKKTRFKYENLNWCMPQVL